MGPGPIAAATRRRRVVLGYALTAGLWIALTDRLPWFARAEGPEAQTLKGMAFIGVTATVLAWLMKVQDQRLYEEQVAREERDDQLQLIAGFTQDVIYRREPDPGRLTYVSPSIFPLLGISPEEALADPGFVGRLLHPDDLDRAGASPEDSVVRRLRWRHLDGHTLWVEHRERDERQYGVVTGIVGVARDVTDAVLDASVAEACSRLEQAVLDGDDVGAGLETELAAVCDVLEGARLRVVIDAAGYEGIDVEVAGAPYPTVTGRLEVARGGCRVELERTERTPAGEAVERCLAHLLGRVEAAVRHDRRREELERVEVALEATGIAIVLADRGGHITWANDAFETLTGLALERVLGDTLAALSDHGGQDLHEVFAAPIAAGTRAVLEVPLTRPDGSALIAAVAAAPVRGAHGVLEGAVISIRDVTDQRRVSSELDAAQLAVVRRQRDLERERTVLVQTLSHELRTPLTVLIGAGKALQREDLSAEARDQLNQAVQRATDDLVRHLDALLAATDGLAGEVMATTGRAIVTSALERLASRHDLRRVQLRGDAPWTGPATDAASLLGPLLHNALKFSAEAQPVEVTIERTGSSGDLDGSATGGLTITIVDRGPGISSEVMASLERPFSQADGSETREHGGLGLGLHAAFRAAERLDARLRLDTEATGTRAVVELPAGGQQPSLSRAGGTPAAPARPGPDQRAASSASASPAT